MTVGEELEDALPVNEYYEYFGPEYRLHFTPSNMENANTPDYLQKLLVALLDNLRVCAALAATAGSQCRLALSLCPAAAGAARQRVRRRSRHVYPPFPPPPSPLSARTGHGVCALGAVCRPAARCAHGRGRGRNPWRGA